MSKLLYDYIELKKKKKERIFKILYNMVFCAKNNKINTNPE